MATVALIDTTTIRRKRRLRRKHNHLQMHKRAHLKHRRPVRLQPTLPMTRHAGGGDREVAVEGEGKREQEDPVRMVIIDNDKGEVVVVVQLGLDGLLLEDVPLRAD